MRACLHIVRRLGRLAGGVMLLLVGLVLLVLPGPGIPLLLGGLVLLETELHWARELRLRLSALAQSALRRSSRARSR